MIKNTKPKDKRAYEGYIPDLLQMISERLGFEYEIYLSPDGKYGSIDTNGEWNGMIKEVKDWQVCKYKYIFY